MKEEQQIPLIVLLVEAKGPRWVHILIIAFCAYLLWYLLPWSIGVAKWYIFDFVPGWNESWIGIGIKVFIGWMPALFIFCLNALIVVFSWNEMDKLKRD